ncbi:hypothetical protein KAR28_04855 [Candidatus Parcubacteria bacterium]|nr:hypothetical protein [Candidatus Parcubacteria bacterium]
MSDYNMIMRNVVEIRLKERVFSFLDFRGSFIDFLARNYDFEKIKYLNNGNRIDVAKSDVSEMMFFGVENFGFQIEEIKDFEIFKGEVKKIFKILDEYGKYRFNNIVRVGAKSTIYCNKKNKSIEALKTIYKNKMFKDCFEFEKISSSKVVDFGHSFSDVEFKNSKASIMTGPIEATEAVMKFFDNSEKYLNNIKKPGFMYVIDSFSTDFSEEINNSKLVEIIDENIDNTQKSFEAFREFLFKKESDNK